MNPLHRFGGLSDYTDNEYVGYSAKESRTELAIICAQLFLIATHVRESLPEYPRIEGEIELGAEHLQTAFQMLEAPMMADGDRNSAQFYSGPDPPISPEPSPSAEPEEPGPAVDASPEPSPRARLQP